MCAAVEVLHSFGVFGLVSPHGGGPVLKGEEAAMEHDLNHVAIQPPALSSWISGSTMMPHPWWTQVEAFIGPRDQPRGGGSEGTNHRTIHASWLCDIEPPLLPDLGSFDEGALRPLNSGEFAASPPLPPQSTC